MEDAEQVWKITGNDSPATLIDWPRDRQQAIRVYDACPALFIACG
jgi:hypothetical protein